MVMPPIVRLAEFEHMNRNKGHIAGLGAGYQYVMSQSRRKGSDKHSINVDKYVNVTTNSYFQTTNL